MLGEPFGEQITLGLRSCNLDLPGLACGLVLIMQYLSNRLKLTPSGDITTRF